MNKIIDKIIQEINNFERKPVYITDKVKYNQFETLKKIITHQNNGFTKPAKGKRFFFNIGNSRVDTVVKKIDFDTKDIHLVSDDYHGLRTLLLESEMRQYLKDTSHAQKINNIVKDFADTGNVVVKKNGSRYDRVNLINLVVVDQTAETLEDTTVIEKHNYNVTEFKRIAKDKNWRNVDNVINEFVDMDDPKKQEIDVHERYGEVSKADLKRAQNQKPADGDENTYVNAVIIAAIEKNHQAEFYLREQNGNYGYVLFAEELEPETWGERTFYKPYREAHFGAFQGRWLRKGPREKLFDLQDRANILGNQIYKAMKWSNLHLFWSQDPNIAGRNIFKSLEQGQILQTNHIQVLPVEERNLQAQMNEWNKLMELADREIQSFEVATGETMPSGTTLGQVEIQSQTVGEHFDFLREELAILFKDIFNCWVLPEIVKEINKEHMLEISGSPDYMERVFDLSAEAWVKQNYIKYSALKGRYLTRQNIEQMKELKKQELAKRPKQVVKIVKNYYKDIQPIVDVLITGEKINRDAEVKNGMMLAQYVSNPQIMQDDVSRSILIDVADKLGFDVRNKALKEGNMQQMAQGGQVPQQGGGQAQERVAQPRTPNNEYERAGNVPSERQI